MTGYQTVASGIASGTTAGGNMAHQRRARNPKVGGGHASMMSSNINILNTIIGAGTLAMPAAMSHFGVVLGILLILWCGLTSAFGLYLQARCARYLDRGTSSFFALSQITYPNAAVVFEAAIAIKCFGVGVSYMIIIGDLMPGVAESFGSGDLGLPFLDDRRFWITAFFLLFIIPLSFPKRLDSLKYTSMVALLAIGYLVLLVVYHFVADEIPNDRDIRIITWEGPVAALSTLPVVIFAYTCHQNMFSILNEIKDNSPGNVVAVIGSSIGTAASVYILVAITGYLTFGNDVKGNIVGMYPVSIASTIAKAAIVALVTFSIPLQIHPCRASIDAVLRWRRGASNPRSPIVPGATVASPGGGSQPLLPSSARAASPTLDSHGAPVQAMSELRFALITSTILVLSYVTALHVSTLDRVLAYVGSTGSTSISFILPGLFYYKISDPNSIHHQRLSKEDDDAGLDDDLDVNDADEEAAASSGDAMAGSGLLSASVASLRSTASGARGRSGWLRSRRKWRWDLEHLETGLLRKLSVCLSVYGFCVMFVCLGMNMFFKH